MPSSPPPFTAARPLRVGTDCSGIDAPIVALRLLGVPFSHEFSSEIDPHCIETLRANFSPRILFGDMTRRRLRDIPDIDLYVCGFPCQPFSTAGKRLGERDPRGTIFYECLRVIRSKRPLVFILENVRGLLSIDGGRTFQTILESLHRLRAYDVQWKILNTADYGIPQSRRRVFIVGIRKDGLRRPFEWPAAVPCRPLLDFVDWTQPREAYTIPDHIIQSGMMDRIPRNAVFINFGFPKHRHTRAGVVCPCITSSKSTMYCVPMERPMSIHEMRQLQGFPADVRLPSSRRQCVRQLGNTMSVNVLYTLFQTIANTLGIQTVGLQ